MKRILKTIFLLIILLIGVTCFSKVEAATANISANKSKVKVGDSASVTVSVNAATWNLTVSGEANDKIVGFNSDAENQKTTKTYKINTSKAGKYTVYLKGDITDANDTNTKINKSVTITVNEKTTSTTNNSNDNNTTKKSSNANLKTLGVTPKEYDFSGFSKNKTNYDVTIPNNVDSLKVSYKTEDAKATVKVTGNSGFEVGSNNTIKVIVTAEDGKTTKTYQIKVTKLATEEEKPGNLIENEKKVYLKSLEIEGVTLSPEFSSDVYSYTANSDTDDNEVKVNAIANSDKAKVEVTGNTNLSSGENLINIVVTAEDGVTKIVYQITLNKTQEVVGNTQINEENHDNSLNLGVKAVRIIIIVVVTIIVLIVIIAALLIAENKKLKRLDEDELFKSDNNELQNLNEIPRTEETNIKNKRSGKHF